MSFVLSYSILFCQVCCYLLLTRSFLMRVRKGVDPEQRGDGKGLGELEGGETMAGYSI